MLFSSGFLMRVTWGFDGFEGFRVLREMRTLWKVYLIGLFR